MFLVFIISVLKMENQKTYYHILAYYFKKGQNTPEARKLLYGRPFEVDDNT